ncbi:conserved hypothetical protein [Thermoplasma acidophilum]|uniref:Transcription regulator TrmB N-terminal domain-containing protein n=1 Tax=Thermoplasma acidophilum (strain ATCC 25905 / DSM 1728 / JCM 9062 / NBRC 15155 / AMRC-C165) TaxID=273075 RepID=Q9HJS4_THEAC|nr:TrmB family transcriptional regulator [Thermoplasma acidophilum]MCY0851186.1 TrmB family transcriptional regulator [Thermoplasma acidophilum]CAC12019.1 conserved hypothetical protein [Thermoplasma acidophilum]
MEANNGKMERIQEMLRMFGLSSYEAQGFAALVYHGVANADTIASTANIPRTSAYKVMESLVRKGLAKATEGRPRMFKPAKMEEIRDYYEEKLQQLFRDLKELEDNAPSRGEPQLIYTINGSQKVMEKIEEMINLTEHEIMISTPKIIEIRKQMKKPIENAIKRGVRVVFVIPPNKRVPANVIVYRRDGLIATDIVSDQIRALIAGPDLETCGYSDNPMLSMHVYQFINILINKPEIQG